MRRALDTARSQLQSLSDRNAILDCFFDHARSLFQFAALFVVRGDTAQGRSVHGLEAPDGLVARLAFPLNEPGVLMRARDMRRPFIGITPATEVDTQLLGSLGRAMPAGLVVPLVVRDRVVAIVIGDGPGEALQMRAQSADRSAVDLAKEEMLLWAETVGEALERLILRKKASGSVPPPAFGRATPKFSSMPPPMFSSAPPPMFPRPAPLPQAPEGLESATEATASTVPPLKSRRYVPFAIAGVVLLGAAAIGAWRFTRSGVGGDRLVLAGATLPGWQAAVDPAGVLTPARNVSGTGDRSEIVWISAEIGRDGKVDFGRPVQNTDSVFMSFGFATDDTEAEVRVDAAGVRSPIARERRRCGNKPCRAGVAPPVCSFAQIFQAALASGVGAMDRAFVTYASGSADGHDAPPEWVLSMAGRGHVRLDAASCKPLPRERLRPPAVALAAIPGAPRAVSPIELTAFARTQSGLEADAVLVEIEARGVDSSGRVDLSGGGDNAIAFTFSDPPTVRVESRRWRQVNVTKDGMAIAIEQEWSARPAMVPPPRCTFAGAHAYLTFKSGVPAPAARVRYGPDALSPQTGLWTLEVGAGDVGQRLSDVECEAWQTVLKK